jgi:hypothetical protein
MKTFNTETELFKFLEDNKEAIYEANNGIIGNYVIPVFASPLTDDPRIMRTVKKWFDLETDTDFGYAVRVHAKKLYETDLSLYKLKIICEYRGPLDEEQFLESVIYTDKHTEAVQNIAMHKDFPVDGKNYMYEQYKDVEYLVQEAQDLFVF